MSEGGKPGAEVLLPNLILPVTAPPIRNGAILIREGRIAAVGPSDEVRAEAPEAEVRELPGHAVIPGAVNTHAHLGFRRKDAPEGGTFAGWLGRLIERLPEKEAWTAEAARDSAREALEAGTTFMAESSPYGECLPALAESGMAGTVYAEFFPRDIGTPEEAVEYIFQRTGSLRQGLPPRVDARVSVHAVYTVDPVSAGLAAERARGGDETLAIHLSESPEEIEFVREGTGGLSDIFGSNDWGGTGQTPVAFAEEIGLLFPGVIAAHVATGIGEGEISTLAAHGVAAAHCPRSNDYLGCAVSPILQMMERGVRVGMGTDGLWSSPSMNLFEETLFALGLHGLDGATALALATIGGAQALGIEGETGSLEAGKWADLAVVEGSFGGGDVEREVLEAAAGGGVVATVVGGDVRYNRGVI
jgi:5-methylthioadenosine/S-adenosylhomocysteine deaminase